MKIFYFFKKRSRYRELLDDYNILTEKYNQLKSLYEDGEKALESIKGVQNDYNILTEKYNQLKSLHEDGEKALESIKGVQNDNAKLEKCVSDACKTCKYCVKEWTPWNASFIVGCNKNVVCECFKEADDQ